MDCQSRAGLRSPRASSFSRSMALTTSPSRRMISPFSTVLLTGATASWASLRSLAVSVGLGA